MFASNSRQGNITVSWTGGSTKLVVSQGPASPELCIYTITVGGQDHFTVPSAGGQFTAAIDLVNTGADPIGCSARVFSNAALIAFVPPGSQPTVSGRTGSVTFTVSANPSPGTQRSGTISVVTPDTRTVFLSVTQQ